MTSAFMANRFWAGNCGLITRYRLAAWRHRSLLAATRCRDVAAAPRLAVDLRLEHRQRRVAGMAGTHVHVGGIVARHSIRPSCDAPCLCEESRRGQDVLSLGSRPRVPLRLVATFGSEQQLRVHTCIGPRYADAERAYEVRARQCAWPATDAWSYVPQPSQTDDHCTKRRTPIRRRACCGRHRRLMGLSHPLHTPYRNLANRNLPEHRADPVIRRPRDFFIAYDCGDCQRRCATSRRP